MDLVIELPVIYATASAEFFAWAAVKLLDSLGIVNSICFGSETGDLAPLNTIAEILVDEPDKYKEYLKQYLGSGLSFPTSREKAIYRYIQLNDNCHSLYEDKFINNLISKDTLGCSNNILGIEYLKALKRLNSNIVPFTIKRQTNLYNEEKLTGTISSATAIRKYIKQSDSQSINYALPLKSMDIMEQEFQKGKGPVLMNSFESIIFAVLRKISTDTIKKYPNINEGLENRIKKAANISGNLEELINNICTKRYTRTRVQRIILSILLDITDEEFQCFNTHGGPQYIRVLGFNEKGRELLSKINKAANLPVIIKTSNFSNSNNLLLKRMLELEALTTDIYVLGYKNPGFRYSGQEYTENVIIM